MYFCSEVKDWEYIVLDLPVISDAKPSPLSKAKRRSSRLLIPILLVSRGGRIEVPLEVVEWSRYFIQNGRRLADQHDRVSAIGRLYDFRCYFPEFELLDRDDFDLLVSSYLHYRLTVPDDVLDRLDPTFTRVRYLTARRDFNAIREFVEFCRAKEPKKSLLTEFLRFNESRFSVTELPFLEKTFFEHLKVRFLKWSELVGERAYFPSDLKFLANKRLRRARTPVHRLSKDEVKTLIRAETNLTFRALWLLLAYVGLRLSEALNLWVCDVLPSASGAHIAGYDTGLPFIVCADPVGSDYTGNIYPQATSPTREQYLNQIGRQPRTFPEELGEHSGWKGILYYDDSRLLSWGHWIDRSAALEFEKLVALMLVRRRQVTQTGSHPYLFVNSQIGPYLGQPLRVKNVEQAFCRLSRKVGIGGGGTVPTPHRLRHFYTDVARKEIGLNPRHIQLLLRHGRIESNLRYGEELGKLHQEVMDGMRSRT